jgi:hypothetical protein
MNKYVFLGMSQKVYISEGPNQREAYISLCDHLRLEDIEILATYLVTDEAKHQGA